MKNMLSTDIVSKKRLVYIDSMKGFAMLCVVLGHIADGYLRSDYYPANYNFLFFLYNIIYSFHMPLFFMISGYLYQRSYCSTEEIPNTAKIFKQFQNLLILYIEFSLLLGVFKIFCSNYVNTEITWKQLLMIGVKTIPPYWYLYVLMMFYLLYCLKPIASCRSDILLTVCIVLSLSSGLIDSSYWFEVKRIMYYSLFWSLGFLHSRQRKLALFSRKVSSIIGVFSVIIMILFWNDNKFICQIPVVNCLVAIGLCLIIWSFFEKSTFQILCNNKLFQIIGKYCLEIYVLHCFFTAGNRVLLKKCHVQNCYVSIVLNLILSIAFPIIIAKASKKLNVYKAIFKPANFIQRRKV